MTANPYVFKFGGSSLKTAERIKKVARLIWEFDKPLVVITSALGGITNSLVDALDNPERLTEITAELRERHLQTATELELPTDALAEFEAHLDNTLADLSVEVDRAAQKSDLVLSIGERLSTKLVSLVLEAKGKKSPYFDSRELVRTDSNWGSAIIEMDETRSLVRHALTTALASGATPLVTGFLGRNAEGQTTTIGRNGSDLSASIFGAIFDSPEVWIWTDVSGICTADPRYHKNAKILPEISYREAAEAAFFGASVLHPHTIWPLLGTKVSVRIKNTFDPEHPGTLVCDKPKKRGNELVTTSVKDVTIITVGGYGMAGIPGVAATIFAAVREVNTSVLMISQSSAEHNITFVVQNEEVHRTVESLERALSSWIKDKHRIDRIKVLPNVSIVTVVGENMRGRHGIAGKIFAALGNNKINVIAIAQGSAEYSISAVIPVDKMREAIDAIHINLDEYNNGK